MKFNVSFAKRLLCLGCIFILCYLIIGTIGALVMVRHSDSTSWMRIVTVLQNIILFITPAIATAVVVTRYPADLLAVRQLPALSTTIWAVAALIMSAPAMDVLVRWNESIVLPSNIDAPLRAAEQAAQHAVNVVMGPHDIPSLIASLLIVALMAAFSEELLFRGTLQRLLRTAPMNTHVAVIVTAIIFSAFHMQFFGFFPRLLLGMFFGYALVWSGSLWLPILLHFINNAIYVIATYIGGENAAATPVSTNIVLVSIAATAICLCLMWRCRQKSA